MSSSSSVKCFEYTRSQDFFNWTTHAAGAMCAAAFTFVDAVLMARTGMSFIAHLVFGLCMTCMFTTSALYHACDKASVRQIFKIFDHCAIYSAITGMGILLAYEYSYKIGNITQFYITSSILTASMAAGWIFKFFTAGRYRIMSTLIYILMGWGTSAAAFPAFSYGMNRLGWLAAGGLAYTAGTAFYVAKAMGWTHCVWHLFVLLGAACHMAFVFGLT